MTITSNLAHVELHFVDSIDEVMELKRWMSLDHPFLAVDTETEGLQWWKDRPRLLQIGNADVAWAIPWHLWGGAILEILRDYRGDIVMHNMTFDIMMFEYWSGVKLPRNRIHDTRIQAHIDSPHLPTGLKPVSERLVDRTAARSQRVLQQAMKLHGWGWDTIPLDFQPYWVYACMDVILTSRVHQILYPRIMAECPNAYDLEMAVCNQLIDMMFRGITVDLDYTHEKLAGFTQYVEQASAWTQREYGVSAGSDAKVVDVLQREFDRGEDVPPWYTFTKLTPKQTRFSLDGDVLKEIIAETHHPLAEVVAKRRKIQSMCSKYLSKFSELAVDGRIHPNYNPVKHTGNDESEDSGYGARTGRMSVSEPPLQQLPRKENDDPSSPANVIRNCITAAPGNTLILCDWDQVEMRIYAHLTRDPGLVAAFSSGDFFVNMAREIFQDPTFEKKDPRRQAVKNGGYANIYGTGDEKLAKTVGIPVAEAAALKARMDLLYPGMRRFNAEVERIAKQREEVEHQAYVRSPITRRRQVCNDGRYYALVNYLIQGAASEVLKMKMLELKSRGLDGYLALLVHDEIILDVPKTDAEDVGRELQDVMTDPDLFTVPLTASAAMAERWGAK